MSFRALLQPGLSSPNRGAHLVLTVYDTVIYLQIRQIRTCAPVHLSRDKETEERQVTHLVPGPVRR